MLSCKIVNLELIDERKAILKKKYVINYIFLTVFFNKNLHF